MSSLIYNKIKEDISSSMKKGTSIVTNTLRFLIDVIQKKLMAKKMNLDQITDDIVIDCINSSIKQREESIIEFKKGNRDDLVQKEMTEIYIIKQYQPVQMSKEELTEIIKDIINPHLLRKAIGEIEKISMGDVMKDVMTELKGKADGKLISEIVKELINKS